MKAGVGFRIGEAARASPCHRCVRRLISRARVLIETAPARRSNDKAAAKTGAPPRSGSSRPKLIVRNATPKDMAAIRALTAKVYAALGSNGAYSIAQLRGHQHHFPEGQFVAVYEDAVVGYCATFRIAGRNHRGMQVHKTFLVKKLVYGKCQ